jgi:hypothetical protein
MTEQPILLPVLSTINSHKRDYNIEFEEVGHKYTILVDHESTYTSVTTWNHSHFPKFMADSIIKNMMRGKNWKEGHKYWGMTPEEIKNQWFNNGASVSRAGTDMHFDIECFMNNNEILYPYTHKELYDNYLSKSSDINSFKSEEWKYFINFIQDFPELKPYRTEWMIYHEDLKLAGSIDMVYEKPDGTLMIYDWKRSKNITKINNYNKYAITECISQYPDANFWHYALQLNTYKAIIEEKYEKKVTELYLVRLHPDAEENTYEILQVPDMQPAIKQLFELRKFGKR